MEGASELGPLQYLSGLTGYGMDKIINWLILIIIFVFDPLAVALVVAFNNAIKVDKGIVDKQKVIRKRELYDEVPEEDEDEDDWDNTLQDGLEDEEVPEEEEELTELQKTLLMDVEDEEEFEEQDINKDGIVDEEEYNDWYENKGWSNIHIMEKITGYIPSLIGVKKKDGLIIKKPYNIGLKHEEVLKLNLMKLENNTQTILQKKTY